MLLRSMILSLVLLIGLVLPTRAQDAAAAERFLRDLYSHYQAGPVRFAPFGDSAADIFTPDLLVLIRKRLEEPGGWVTRMRDVDPLCACQDYNNILIGALTLAPVSIGRTIATVTLYDGEENVLRERTIPVEGLTTLEVTLAAVNGVWRIDDVRNGDASGLRQMLNAPSP